MAKYYYKKGLNFKKILRVLGFIFIAFGGALFFYILFPVLSWQIFFAGAYSQSIDYPIPKTTVVGTSNFESLLSTSNLTGIDYTNAQNWFPNFKYEKGQAKVPFFNLSIPAIDIEKAEVSTLDNNLGKHLVNYNARQIPPDNGNAVIFGHSTLPYLFDPKDYKTIFANLYKLKVGDTIWTHVNNVSYKYKVFDILVVDPKNTSVLEQKYNDSFLTLVTCTPPGTVWKRLIIKAKLDTI